ncbi:MAG: hypothetical protein AAFY15_16745, partial [Cyanobacteria bacterium J06648_11]
DKTLLMLEYTPILSGDNVLARGAGLGGLQGNDDIYRLGVRQLLVNSNSAYAVDVYYGNSLGNYGLQGITTLPSGDSHLGVRFSVLNGIPSGEQNEASSESSAEPESLDEPEALNDSSDDVDSSNDVEAETESDDAARAGEAQP